MFVHILLQAETVKHDDGHTHTVWNTRHKQISMMIHETHHLWISVRVFQ